VAQIADSASFDGVKDFQRGQWTELEHFRPRVLVGAETDLHELAQKVQAGAIELSSVDHAIFVLTGCGDKPLTDVLRVVLWQTFGVPVYELFVPRGGILAASECETHDGWHVQPGATFSLLNDELLVHGFGLKAMRTGFTAVLEPTPCPCGREGMRLMNISLRPQTAQRLAATA
jgi:phenylacetate-coenzyme A ligase PaaK-like adenylate-forming protein